jgi:lysophospholipase L1-like esterase
VFVGSSSIRLWDLYKSFEGVEPVPLNRGFGGSQIADATHFADRLVLKHKPRLIVFYAGDNDIAVGKSAKKVAEDFSEFCKVIHDKLPQARILFISIKPSPSRWKLAEEAMAANEAIREQCESDELLEYVDVWAPMLGSDGQPRPKLFVKDMLHMNDAGYELWTQIVKPLLAE